ncbi:MAG: hypothetical protein ACLPND_10500 [Candidatus Korobacteraceae bacterium]
MQDIENFPPAATEYATHTDFCRTFKQDMKSLYLLSLLLTAGRHLAEQCFVSSLGDCLNMRPVLKEWADSWTRRVVLQNAIRMLKPAVNNADKASQPDLNSIPSGLNPALQAVVQLSHFERFVLVMTVLEGYSDHECSLLLRSSKRDVAAAKAKALERLGTTSGPNEFPSPAPHAEHQFAAMDKRQGSI